MLGWRSRAMVRASARKRRTMEGCAASSGWTTLTATRRSRVVSVAKKTTPIPPRPSSRSSRYWGASVDCRLAKRSMVVSLTSETIGGELKNTPALRLGHTIGGGTIARQPELDAPGLEKVAGTVNLHAFF